MESSQLDPAVSTSVLIPVYRPNPEWFRLAIESLVQQDFRSWQLVLSLDGNDAKTLAAATIARDVISGNNPLIVINGPKTGIVGALNRGLASCTTEFTLRVDCDDICLPHRFVEQMRHLRSDPGTVACGMQMKAIDESGNMLDSRLHKYPRTSLGTLAVGAIFNTPVAHPALAFRTNAAIAIGGYRELPCMEDYDFLARLSSLGNILNLVSTGVLYRLHENQHSRSIRPSRMNLLRARMRFVQSACRLNVFCFILILPPLALYCLGPQIEYIGRRAAGNVLALAAKALNKCWRSKAHLHTA